MTNSVCARCGAAVSQYQGQVNNFIGQICQCHQQQIVSQWQGHAPPIDNSTLHMHLVEIIHRLDRIEKVLEAKHGKP